MTKKNKSPKAGKDAQIVALTPKQEAEAVLKLAKEQQRVKELDPNLTAVIVKGDRKESRLKWIKTDELNEKLGR